MLTELLANLTHSQRDRLAFVELRVRFIGEMRRQDLVSRFGIQSAAATRDLALYKDLAPGNIEYDSKAKSYVLGPAFHPIFDFPPERVLSWLTQGFGDGEPMQIKAWLASESPSRLTHPDLNVLASVTRAIHQERPLAIEHFYYRFDASPIDGREQRTIERGAIPLVSWNDTDPRTILDGSQDAYVRAAARRFAALPGRVLLRFGWEMDRPTDTSTDAAAYVQMWRRMRTLFAEEGADRVEWIWCPTDWAFNPASGRTPQRWYPGDDAVDWLCADGYGFYPETPTWTSFETTLGFFYRWAEGRGKPIMIGETGAIIAEALRARAPVQSP